MSRTVRDFNPSARMATQYPERDGQNHRGVGFEYWSRRSEFREPGHWSKMMTHRAERRAGKVAAR